MRQTYRANPTWESPPRNWRVFLLAVNSANQVVRMSAPRSEALNKTEATTRAKRLNQQRRQEAVR